MENNTYIEILKSKLWIIILGAILSGLACYYIAATYTNWPQYEAEATLQIDEGLTDRAIRDKETLNLYHNTIAELAVRAPLTERVVEKTGLSISATDLAKLIRVQIIEKTWLTEITVIHKDPNIAANIANAVVQDLNTESNLAVKTDILSPAEVPQYPLFSSYLFIFIIGIFGAVGVFGLLCWAEFRNDTVRHERDIRQNLDIPLLGMINEEQKENKELGAVAQQHYQWLFAKIFMTNASRPSTLLITSPLQSTAQSPFVHKFVNQNLRGEHQPLTNQILLSDDSEGSAIWQPEEKAIPTSVEQGPVYDLEIDEAILGTPDNQLRTYRHIHIVDAPPVLSNANTMLLAQRFDSVLLIIEANKTKIRDIKDAIQLLQNSGTPVIGSVLLA